MKITRKEFQDYVIEASELEFTLLKNRTNQKTGENYLQVIGHYTELGSAIAKIVKVGIIEANDTIDLQEYVEQNKAATKELTELFKGM